MLATLLGLAGCQTPDLKPFAAASGEVAASINQGGELAISALARETFKVNEKTLPPGSPDHPAKKIATEWEVRKKAADALLVYSASLAALSDASANRKENATALYGSVQKLAAAIPGISLGSSALGNLMITAASGVVEVMAWKNMGAAVKGADPAIQLVGRTFKADLASLSTGYADLYEGAIMEAKGSNIRDLRLLYENLRTQQAVKRDAIAGDPTKKDEAAELARLDTLLAPIERELSAHREKIERIEMKIEEGQRFYAKAAAAVDAWAAAHSDLAQAFEQKRLPNLALLTARVQELQACLAALKNNPQPATTP